MKTRFLFILVFLLFAGMQTKAITTGYYRVVSYNGKYLTENSNSHALVCSNLIEGNYSQVWYLDVSGTDVSIKNVLTDRYVKGQGSATEQYQTDTYSTAFTVGESDGTFTFKYDPYGFYSGGLHCDAQLNVVQYDVADSKSKWTLQSAEVDASALAAQKAAKEEASLEKLTQYFTDGSCTSLKSAQSSYSDELLISTMSNDVPQTVIDMALKVKNSAWTTYDGWDKTERSFRIGSYKAYSKHDRWSNIIGCGHVFGRLTNPTGIYATSGEYLYVYVGTIPSGQNVMLEVAGAGQGAGVTYNLHEGMNTLLMASSGNCYVLYEVDNTTSGKAPYTKIDSYPAITVHIEGGDVQGYFDLTKGDDNNDWANLQKYLLKNPTTVELKTNNLLFHMSASLVTAACPTSMVELLGEWDKILDMEYSLMGLEDFVGYWNNLLGATDITGDSYMYATNYGTYYHTSTISSVMSYEDMFAGGAIWGPAHENGHIFQKYINMIGQTEVSNNMFSNVAVYNNGHLTSRATNISTTFENMANNVFWNDRGIWERTHLYFQLYQFFHILNKADFYPKLFKALRNDPMIHTGNTFVSATDDYLKFYKKCCQVSGYDLTEFFQAYGFFVIPSLTSYVIDGVTKDAYKVEDYTNYYLTITQSEIDAAKQAVADMKLPKANIIFIEDRITAPDATYEGAGAGAKKIAFSNEFPIGQAGETGQYTTFNETCSAYKYNVKDGAVTMDGTGAVGFKVYDSAGNLRGLYNTYSFTLPDGIGTDYTIKAAAGNGSDNEATYDASVGVIESDVTDTGFIKAGSQITAENQISSGQLYLIYYVGNGNSGYMKDTGSAYTGKDDNNVAPNAVYRFVSNGDGTWKVQNYATGKYWGTPTANANTYIGSDTPGAWALNFQSNNYVAPSCNGHSWNRSGSNIHPWSPGTANVNQLKIMEVSPVTELADEFADKDISVSAKAAASLETGKWYVMFDRGTNHGYLYENGENKLYNTSTAPSGSATDNAKYLVRIVGWNNEYYLQTGLGNFFGKIQHSTNVPTTEIATEQITIKKIAGTDGHFYLMSADGIVLDANSLEKGDATVVGWGSTAPTATGGNNDWAFYPVEFVDSWIPTIAEVYTINNTNTQRGAMMYAPSQSETYVWSSGKNSQTFSATDPNCQWVIVPTGTAKQYYIYNVGANKFAIPSGTNSTASWIFSPSAVAVTLLKQNDGTFKIKTVTTDTYAAVSNGFNGPIINYNDIGGNFTITKVDDVSAETAATVAFNKLADNVTPLEAVPAADTDGWYIIRIKQHGSYADKYVYSAATEINYSGTYYPLTFDHGANVRPVISDVTYYTRISLEGNKLYCQLPNGKYLYGNNSKFPVSTTTKSTCSMDYTSGKGFRMWGGSHYAVPYYLGSQYFIGETATATNAYYDIYPVDLTAAGLTPWQVTVENGSDATQLACNRNDVVGATTVYNNGFFFLPTGVTPEDGDFSMTGMLGCTIDAENHTISVQYDPELSLTSADVAVNQGNQTAGQGNEMQALLRIKVKPFTDFQPTQFTVNLTGADNVDNVKVYYTYNDEIRAASAAPELLGTATASEGAVAVNVTAPSVDAGTTLYYWITADVKSNATELATIDASLTSISYTNVYKAANNKEATVLDLAAQGNPDGEMRIFKVQSYPWTASHINTKYYRIPTIINTADGGILAFTDDRYSNTNDLGSHKIDVVARKSMDGGLTWGEPVTVAAGDGSSDAGYGYGDPAVVRTNSGKLICLMAAGKNSFAGGMLHMGYSESTDNGATWSTVKDIYSDINKNGAEITSAFTTAGKGVTFSNGRVAFAMNGKVNGTNNEFVLYSDDEGETWSLSPSIFSGADESKLEIMNDNSLLVSVRRGGWNTLANRGYNRTTGDASGDGINSWNEQGVWGNEMNANGCNADILYYNRETENQVQPDVIFHTLTKRYSTYRCDLRLYMSFDQGETWMEVFQIQPGYAAYSSMQKLANGDLAIIFEDGSIGNQDKSDCFAINYITISKGTIEAKIQELYEQSFYSTATIISKGETNGSAPWGTWNPTGWANTFITNASSGAAGVVVSANDNLLNRETDYGQRVFCIKPSAAGATDVFTITAPEGYLIKKYSLGGFFWKGAETYTLTSEDGTKTAEINKNSGTPEMLTDDDIYAKSTTFTMKSNGSTNEKFACITDFTVQLVKATTYTRDVLADRWGTVCIPGAVVAANISGAEVYRIVGKAIKKNGEPSHIFLEQVTSMEAGKPYIFYAAAAGQLALTYPGSTAVFTPGSENGLFGSFVGMDVEEGMCLLSNNSIIRCGTGCNIGANRAYIDMNEVPVYEEPVAGVKSIRIIPDEDEETGIDVINNPTNTQEEMIYDLSGRKITSKLGKRIYIKNGKKAVF